MTKTPFAFVLTLTATPALAIDPSLVRKWQADGADMASVLAKQMNAQATYLSGQTIMDIDEFGNLTLLSDNMTYAIQAPEMPAMEVSVNGFSEGAMNANDGHNYRAVAAQYSLVGSAEVFGQRMDIPITQADGGWGTSTGIYGCTDTGIAFEANELGTIPRSWTRLE
ncbi:hypothetical protein SAMN05444003_3139 [Cognatiyoonia sediminum]|uniref:Uncharacterized protein n=1 Tax=Cognatiyoonia sediminum TaxID=1508389 RepID=A0A1M5SV95_9RHOB|nr:hypothetical protein [Cognatiyoonia sediminum]SHH42491.1 hypothetical protein SAMN05444003_3139 [Cognatiyoonia sediminum]